MDIFLRCNKDGRQPHLIYALPVLPTTTVAPKRNYQLLARMTEGYGEELLTTYP